MAPRKATASAKPSSSLSEGGWGYVVVASNFVLLCLVLGLLQTQSFFYVEWQKYFSATSMEASLLASMCLVVWGIFSPVAGFLATAFGNRIVVMIGGLITSVGMIITMQMESILGIILAWGVVVGCGFGLAFTPSLTMIGKYFVVHFTAANSVAFTGVSVGQIVFPLLAEFLINIYGWRGAILILSSVMLHLVVCGIVLRPPKPSVTKDPVDNKSVDVDLHEQPCDTNLAVVDVDSSVHQSHFDPNVEKGKADSNDQQGNKSTATVLEAPLVRKNTVGNKGIDVDLHEQPCDMNLSVAEVDSSVPQSHLDTISENGKPDSNDQQGNKLTATVLEVDAVEYQSTSRHNNTYVMKSLLRNIKFLIFLCVFFITGCLFFAPIAHSIPRATADGIDGPRASLLPTIFGVGSLIGRLGPGVLVDCFHLPRDITNIFSFGICTLANILNPMMHSYWSFVLYAIIYGAALGSIGVFTFTIIQDLIPVDQRTVGLGFATLFLMAGDTIGAVIVGWLFDITGNYDVAFYTLGALGIVGTLLLIVVAYLQRHPAEDKTTSDIIRNDVYEENGYNKH